MTSSTPRSRATISRSSVDMLPAETAASIEAAEEKRIADAIAFAEASEFPADREVFDHVFTN